ncbi:ATP-binding cassette domain-containing protein [Microbacterium paraoxydans]|uniref:ABC transporter ATP-binding protein C-terminal domain-containing protein n=1 Tax=Microbacterium paraoxydans TaxID=199592 RepID=UPI0022B22586|nr:ATP-binding cassette domain-containing protein [Microbacterium sp. H83]
MARRPRPRLQHPQRLPFGPSAGTVRFEGRRVDNLHANRISRRGLRRTFQAEQLFGTMTVEENVLVAAAYLRTSSDGRRNSLSAEAAAALETTGIGAYGAARASDVPLIVKKKLMIASALVAGPKLLMLDEPAGGLDDDDQADLVALLGRLRDTGVTLLIIEHVLSLLRAVAPRMLIMSAGRILAEGPPSSVLSDPAVIEAYLGQGHGT